MIKALAVFFSWLMLLVFARSKVQRESFEPACDNVPIQPSKADPVGAADTIEYNNRGKMPWERHALTDSLPLDHKVKYPNTFYYEKDNREFEEALTTKLVHASQKMIRFADNGTQWDGPYDTEKADPLWIHSYEELLKHIAANIDQDYQIIHDRWVRFFVWKRNPNVIRGYVELALFKEGKYQAKHILLTVVIEAKNKESWKFHITKVRVVGVIPSDKFGLFPVVSHDPINPVFGDFDAKNPYAFEPLILISDQDVLAELKRRRDNIEKRFRTSAAIGSDA